MAGMGPPPKNPKTRQRRNKHTTAAKLPAEPAGAAKPPALPTKRKWHERTRAWWKDIWASPMAHEFLKSDYHGLFLLAVLVDEFWRCPTKELAAEIRLQRQCFGLTPMDRRRLQWEVEKVETATSKRKAAREPAKQPKRSDDPRRHLSAVS